MTYDPGTRKYLVGEITGDYYFASAAGELPHRRTVTWQDKQVPRDDLKLATRNSLGSTLTLYRVIDESWSYVQADRANTPITLLDLDGLAWLIETHYDNFDTEARTLLPLIKVLWPAD